MKMGKSQDIRTFFSIAFITEVLRRKAKGSIIKITLRNKENFVMVSKPHLSEKSRRAGYADNKKGLKKIYEK
jgi:hypothetical protein